jgi:cytochrome c peroxidase
VFHFERIAFSRSVIWLALCFALASASLAVERGEPFMPLPLSLSLDQNLIRLGEKLFSENRLSQDSSQSCASCHDLAYGAIDRREAAGPSGDRFNAPTLFNSGFHFRYFWNGRAASLEEQIELTIYSPTVFRNNWETIVKRLAGDAGYKPMLDAMQPGKILDGELIKQALAEFERSLWTPNSRFDKFLRGDGTALTELEKKGFETFKSLGCSSCHQGMLLGGNMFQRFGIFGVRPQIPAELLKRDLGRYSVTGRDEDRFVFKVPSLRNVALTAPYLHNGAASSLEDAVKIMGRVQLGRQLTEDEVKSLVKFLATLTGEWRGRAL